MSELSRRIWDGSLNVIITLNPSDSNQQERKHEYYLKANRNSYFPSYFPRILQFFEPYLLVPEWASRSNWWLEFEEAPLKWNLQIGLLYDTLTVLDPQRRKDNVWKLTLNYRNYPEDYILPLESPETLRMTWLNQVKESCYVANGSAKPIMTLSKQNTDELWESVMSADYDMFWNVFPKISPPLEQMKHVPVRIHLSFSNKVLDVPIVPLRNGEPVTVGQVLHDQSPDLFPSIRNNILAKAILHGITVPLTTPLAPLYRETLYIDGFIHFSIILMT